MDLCTDVEISVSHRLVPCAASLQYFVRWVDLDRTWTRNESRKCRGAWQVWFGAVWVYIYILGQNILKIIRDPHICLPNSISMPGIAPHFSARMDKRTNFWFSKKLMHSQRPKRDLRHCKHEAAAERNEMARDWPHILHCQHTYGPIISHRRCTRHSHNLATVGANFVQVLTTDFFFENIRRKILAKGMESPRTVQSTCRRSSWPVTFEAPAL